MFFFKTAESVFEKVDVVVLIIQLRYVVINFLFFRNIHNDCWLLPTV